jgi:hypothetical protein
VGPLREFNPSRAILRRSAPCVLSHGTLDRIRTRDNLIRSQVLYPLSYEGLASTVRFGLTFPSFAGKGLIQLGHVDLAAELRFELR